MKNIILIIMEYYIFNEVTLDIYEINPTNL